MFGPFCFSFDQRSGSDSSAEHRGRWNWEGFESMWGGGRARGHWRGRAARMFEQGDLKYVILRMLEEKPRHGYEIIKDLEARFGGAYAPSPGTVYPTLTMLEDLGYARAVPEESGRKIYEITDEGRKYLAENSNTVDEIFSRIARFVEGITDAPMTELNSAFRRLARDTYSTATQHLRDREKLAAIKSILERAAGEIEALTK